MTDFNLLALHDADRDDRPALPPSVADRVGTLDRLRRTLKDAKSVAFTLSTLPVSDAARKSARSLVDSLETVYFLEREAADPANRDQF
jgi:hypothetical protein